ncbi:uncharacterized protein LOC133178633 [Saccostrea echinata]|uniref:uncharacterized protein LOC133178633 n=1 Tax=Saccostrea echinata TaxID=191078 RepID=UPI002A823A1A|nr:uncharacterized protein LOC133178633 [Saccostrea echinata]
MKLPPHLKPVDEISDSKNVFLDITSTLIDCKIEFSIDTKPTDSHLYLMPTSCHPLHTFKGIHEPKGLATGRCYRILGNLSCQTDNYIYLISCKELTCPGGFFLRSRGVCKNNNLALKSPVIMSSVFDDPDYADFRHGDGSLAVNGEVRTDDKECAHTNTESQPWLTVDLLDQFYVRRVVFVNRKHGEWRLHDLNVTVGTTNMAFPCFCGFFTGPGTSHQRVDMACKENCRGRYVRLQIISPVPEILQLCEVEVYSDCNI